MHAACLCLPYKVLDPLGCMYPNPNIVIEYSSASMPVEVLQESPIISLAFFVYNIVDTISIIIKTPAVANHSSLG